MGRWLRFCVVLAVVSLSSPSWAAGGACLDFEALWSLTWGGEGAVCDAPGCGDAVVGETADEPEPCFQDEYEGRCKAIDEPETLESVEAAQAALTVPEKGIPLSTLALACYASRTQCSGLPAPSPFQRLANPMPTSTRVDAPVAVSPGWVRESPQSQHFGLGPSEGVLRTPVQPPQA